MFHNVAFFILVLITLLPFLVLLFTLIWATFVKKTDIIDTKENTLKIGMAVYINTIYLLFLFFQIIQILLSYEPSKIVYVELFVVLVATFPIISLIFSYFNLNRYFNEKFKLTELRNQTSKERDEQSKIWIEKISENLELKWKPKILISNIRNISPFVFGKSRKRSYIVFPMNWNEILEEISKGDNSVNQKIRQFVIMHELSHIRHGDHIFVGLSYAFLKSFKFWVATVIIGIGVYSLIGLTEATFSLYRSILYGLIYYGILFFLTRSVSRNREFTADARASVFMSEKDLEAITQRLDFRGQNVSFFESILNWFSMFPKLKTNIIGISGSQTSFDGFISRVVKKIDSKKIRERISKLFYETISAHPQIEVRRRNLREKHLVGKTRNIKTKGTAIWIGVFLALFSITTTAFFTEEVTGIVYNKEVMGIRIIIIFCVLIAITISLLFIASFTTSTAVEKSYKKYLYFLIKRFFIISAVFYISVICLYLFMSLIEWKFFLIKPEYIKTLLRTFHNYFLILLASFFLTVVFSAMHSISFHSKVSQEARFQKHTFIFGLVVAGIISLFVLFLVLLRLQFLSVFFGVLMGSSIILYLLTKFIQFSNALQRYEVFGIKNFIIKYDTKVTAPVSLPMLSIFLAIFFVSMLIMAIIVNNVVSFPLTFVGSCLMFLVYLKTTKALRPSYGGVCFFLYFINAYLYILKILGYGKFLEIKDLIRKKIDGYKLADNSFTISRLINIGSSFTNHDALSLFHHIGFENLYKKSAEWFLNLENEGGGFSPIKGLKSRLESTNEALIILDKYNMIDRVNVEVHKNWIESLQTEKGIFRTPISRDSELLQTYCALNSLFLLGSLGGINKRSCIEWCFTKWKEVRKLQSHESVFYSLKCLELLREINEDLKRDVRDNWLMVDKSYWKSLRVEKDLESFYYFFKVAEIVMDKKEDIKNLIPGIEEKVYNSFVYYLENR